MIGFAISRTVANGDGSGWLPEAIRFIDLTPRNYALWRPLPMVSHLKNPYLWLRHVGEVAHLIEPNESANPVPAALLGPWAVMACSNGISKLITESRAPATIRVRGCSLVSVHLISVMEIAK